MEKKVKVKVNKLLEVSEKIIISTDEGIICFGNKTNLMALLTMILQKLREGAMFSEEDFLYCYNLSKKNERDLKNIVINDLKDIINQLNND